MLQQPFTVEPASARTEILAGTTTFLAMAYIIFVQPAVLSGAMTGAKTGMDFGALTTATCLAAAFGSALMGLYARYPLAQAPGMGENFFFVFTAIPAAVAAGFPPGWPAALGAVFWSGTLFLILSWVGIREQVMDAISPSMKSAIAVGIGLFIAFIGLENASVILKNAGTGVRLNPHLASPDLVVFSCGFFVAAILQARQMRGSLLWGIAAATAASLLLKSAMPLLPQAIAQSKAASESMLAKQFAMASAIVSMPPSLSPTFFKMDLAAAFSPRMWPIVLAFLFMVLFDTVGTLVGVAQQAGLMKDNRLPRARQAFISDAAATTLGACLGTSTVTSYIESAAGVAAGGRTGLTSLTVAVLFLLALFFSPIISMVGSYPPITAPVLVLVGALMVRNVTRIDWADETEAIPAFLAMVGVPLTYSIADGLALGFIAYPILKLGAGRARELHWLWYPLALLLAAYFIWVRSRLE